MIAAAAAPPALAGDGTFKSASDLTPGSAPSLGIAVGDFNRDGVSDLAIANFYDNNVSVRLGKGDGTFKNAPDVSAGTYPRSVAVGDFNGDGIPDLAIGNLEAYTSIRLGNGDGTFPERRGPPVRIWHAGGGRRLQPRRHRRHRCPRQRQLRRAGKRRRDLQERRRLYNRREPRPPWWSGTSTTTARGGPRDHELRPEGHGPELLRVHSQLGSGDGYFTSAPNASVGDTPGAIAGRLQPRRQAGPRSRGCGRGDHPARRRDRQFAATPRWADRRRGSIAVGDFNSDGIQDLALGRNGAIAVRLGKGDGRFANARRSRFRTTEPRSP